MPTAAEMAVIIKAKDELSGAMKKAATSVHGFGDEAKAGSKSSATLGQSLAKLAVAGAALAGIVKLGKGIAALVVEAAAVPGISRSFENLGGSIGVMRAATAGMVKDVDLMKAFNQAAQLVSVDFAQRLPDAMQYLSKVAASTGQDMQYMLDSLVRGVGRLSPMILDNLGIQVSATEANEAYAASIGKTAEQLSKSEQQTAMMNLVLEKLRANTAAMPEVTGSTATQFASLGTTFANLKIQIGEELLPVAGELVGRLAQLASDVGPKVVAVVRTISQYIQNLSPGAKTAALAIMGVVAAVLAVSGAFAAFSVMLATNPLGLAILGITALALGLVAIADMIQKQADRLAAANIAMGAAQARAGVAYEAYAQDVLASSAEMDQATRRNIAHFGEEYAMQRLLASGAMMTRAEYETLAGTYAHVVTRASGAALAHKMARDELVFEGLAVASLNSDIFEQLGIMGRWTAEQAAVAAAAKAAAEEMVVAGMVMLAAFDSEAMIKQLASNQQAFAAHGQKMVKLAEEYGGDLANSEFEYLLARAQAQQKYQQEHVAMLAAGRLEDAAELAAKFAGEHKLAEGAFATQQGLQQRNFLIQQIAAKRAYIEELGNMRDQTLRVLQEQVKAEAIKRGMSTEAINVMLSDIAKAGSDALQLETANNILRTEATKKFWIGQATMVETALKAIAGIIAAQGTAEDAAKALEGQLKALQNSLLANLPALPPIDTSGWEASIASAEGAGRAVEESATRSLASVVDDIEKAVTSALSAIKKLVTFDVPAGVDIGLGRLADFIIIAVQSFYSTLSPLKTQITAIKDLLDPVSGIFGVIAEGVTSMTALGGYVSAANLTALATQLAEDIAKVAVAFRDVFVGWDETINGDSTTAAGEWWVKVVALVGSVKGGVDAMKALTEYAPVKNLVAKVETLASDIIKTATAFRDVFVNWLHTTNLQQESLDWWAKVTALVGNVKGGADTMKALTEYAPVKNLVAKVEVLASDVIKTATAFRDVFVNWLGTTNLQQGALDWWASVTAMVGNVKGGVDAMAALTAYAPVKNLTARAQVLADDMIKVATAFRDVFVGWIGTTNLTQAALDWWAKVATIMAPVKAGVDMLAALAGYKPVKDLVGKAAALASDMAKVATALRDVFLRWVGTTNLTQAALDWWNNIKEIVGVVKPGIDALAALASYAPVKNLANRVLQLSSAMRTIAETLNQIFLTWGGDLRLTQAALNWWNKVKELVGIVKPGIDALAALATYTHVKHLGAKIGGFARDIVIIAQRLKDAFVQWGRGGRLRLNDAAREWWNDIKEIVGVIGPGSSALTAIGGYAGTSHLASKMGKFCADLIFVATSLKDAWREFGPRTIRAGENLAEALVYIQAVLSEGLATLGMLGDVGSATAIGAIRTFVTALDANLRAAILVVQRRLEEIRQALISATPPAYAAGYAYGDAIRRGISDGMGPLPPPQNSAHGGALLGASAPLRGNRGGGGRPVTILVTGNNVRSENDLASLTERVRQVVIEELRR